MKEKPAPYILSTDWTEENKAEWVRTFDLATKQYEEYSLWLRGANAQNYAASLGTMTPSKVCPSDWCASVYNLGNRILHGRRNRIFILHYMLGLSVRGTMEHLGMVSRKTWAEECHHIKCVIGRRLLELEIWPPHNRITRRGYLD
jgi:hypothetical protein